MKILSDLTKDVAENPDTFIKLQLYAFDRLRGWEEHVFLLPIKAEYIKNLNGEPAPPMPGFIVDAGRYAGKQIKAVLTINKRKW